MTISSSGIDATKPVEGTPTTSSVRDNFTEIKTQFDNTQADVILKAPIANPTFTGVITGTLATAAQPNITSLGTITAFTSTGIDDNSTATAITIDSSENVTFTGTIAGTLATAAQPNITSLGTIASLVATTADINAGTVDATIGATTPAPITCTTFTSTGIDDNATSNAITIDSSENVDFAENVSLVDSKHLYLGADNDLDIYHDGTHSRIYNQAAGGLIISNNATSQTVRINAADSVGSVKNCIIAGGATPKVSSYYDGAEKFASHADGLELVLQATTSTATSGAQTLPANPVGFIKLDINGTTRRIPYYAA